ncbi:MAG: AAA family ATPase [Actinomycetota bacterium]|nr:AAA family ATPase [Actinomycetota bacterium]
MHKLTVMDLEELMGLLGEERARRGLSLEEVARRAGWANESIPRRLERPGGNPTLRSVRRYTEAVGAELKVALAETRVLSFFNHAGGVGKTSAARDLGYALSALGFRVLLIDADPQANLTAWLGVREEIPLERTLYPAVIGGPKEPELPEPLEVHGFHLIPSTLELARLEPQLIGVIMGVTRLRSAVRRLSGYDFVLIDPPPSLGQLSALAVIASQHVIVPVPTNVKGFEGVKTVVQMVQEYRQAAPDLTISMFVLTHFDGRTRHDRESEESMREELSSLAPVSSPLRYRPAVYKDASLAGLPVPLHDAEGKAEEEIGAVAGELLAALGVKVGV